MLPDVNYLKPTEFLIRAKPAKIGISERYERKIEQDIAVRETDGKEPEGKVEIVIPYDGEGYFGPKAVVDAINHELNEAVWRQSNPLAIRGRIGYLHFRGTGKVDLLKTLKSLNTRENPDVMTVISRDNVMSLETILRHWDGRTFHNPVDDTRTFTQEIPYKPDLKAPPLTLALIAKNDTDEGKRANRVIQIFDEELIDEEMKGEKKDWDAIISKLRYQERIGHEYTIPLLLSVRLKRSEVVESHKEIKVNLRLDCPKYEGARLIRLGVKGEEKQLTSTHLIEGEENRTGFLLWSQIVLNRVDDKESVDGVDSNDSKDEEKAASTEPTDETKESEENKKKKDDTVTYRSAPMVLRLLEPVIFWDVAQLTGRVTCRLPWLLSGLQCIYFDAYGRPYRPQINAEGKSDSIVKMHSDVTVHFELGLTQFGQDKQFVPSQRLYFTDVPYDDERVSDIIKLLSELSFDVDAPEAEQHPTRVAEDDAFEPKVVTQVEMNENGSESAEAETGTERTEPEEKRPNGKLIYVQQDVGRQKLGLYVHVYGFQSKTRRERHAHIGQNKFTSERTSGYVVIDMAGTTYGDSSRLIALMNTIHLRLKYLFQHVSRAT